LHSAHRVDLPKLLPRLAELVPPATGALARRSRYDELIAADVIEPAAAVSERIASL
jgi:hypothetical protein